MNITTVYWDRDTSPLLKFSLSLRLTNQLPNFITLTLQCHHFLWVFSLTVSMLRLHISCFNYCAIVKGQLVLSFLHVFAHSISEAWNATCLLCVSQSYTFFHAQIKWSITWPWLLTPPLSGHNRSIYLVCIWSCLAFYLSRLPFLSPSWTTP